MSTHAHTGPVENFGSFATSLTPHKDLPLIRCNAPLCRARSKGHGFAVQHAHKELMPVRQGE